ncbi:hypothetical protein JCM8097_005496 [Rhodosporidiobolus ruineniae]
MSSSTSQTVYFVSGANRGLGYGIVSQLAERSDVLIFATARDPEKATALNSLAAEKGNIVVLKLAVDSEEDAKAAAQVVQEKAGKLDVLIANAGISDSYYPAANTPVDVLKRHFDVNALGPVILFSALQSLLYKISAPKFLVVSTAGASFGLAIPMAMTGYFVSKAAVNFWLLKLAQEEGEKHNLTALALSPGWVQTDMGNKGARQMGVEAAPVTLDDSVTGILKLADSSTRESHGGKFWDYTGDAIPW